MAVEQFTLTKKYLDTLFEYRDGCLYRKVNKGNRIVGSFFGSPQKNGYYIGSINNKSYYIHRLIFLMNYGYMPKTIDHIDGNPSNNKIENLRECTQSENLCNKAKQKNNTSGYKNVCWNKIHKKWFVRINRKNYKPIAKMFVNINEAIVFAEKARLQLHQEFAKPEVPPVK